MPLTIAEEVRAILNSPEFDDPRAANREKRERLHNRLRVLIAREKLAIARQFERLEKLEGIEDDESSWGNNYE